MGVVLLAPLYVLAWLIWIAPELDRLLMVPRQHFYIVSAAALAAFLLATGVAWISVKGKHPDTFALTVAFLCVAGIFSVHGLMTPGPQMMVKEMHNGIVISARLSLLFGAVFFAISTATLTGPASRIIRRHHSALLAGTVALLAVYVAGNLLKPDLLDFLPTGTPTFVEVDVAAGALRDNEAEYTYTTNEQSGETGDTPRVVAVYSTPEQFGRYLGYAMAIVGTSLLAFAAWRFYQTYTMTRTPATGALAAGLVLLAEAQVIMALGEAWHLSWWLYHGSMLVGFVLPIAGIGLAYRRGGNLNDIVEGLFVRDALAKAERSFPEAINTLIGAIETKDPYLRGHMRRVAELTVKIAEELDLPAERIRAASHAALLHDIGKLGLPEDVLHKPGRLTDEEFEVLKQHPERGYRMVIQAPVLHHAAPAIRWHHERLDGTGYPDRIAGDEIPLEARIVAVADVWDALTSDRVYRTAMPLAAAQEILLSEAGTKLDESCIQALFSVLLRERPIAVPSRKAYARPAESAMPSFLAS